MTSIMKWNIDKTNLNNMDSTFLEQSYVTIAGSHNSRWAADECFTMLVDDSQEGRFAIPDRMDAFIVIPSMRVPALYSCCGSSASLLVYAGRRHR